MTDERVAIGVGGAADRLTDVDDRGSAFSLSPRLHILGLRVSWAGRMPIDDGNVNSNPGRSDLRTRSHSYRRQIHSWLLAGGADLLAVKERLGHASITTTEQYLHSLPGAHDAALQALDVIRGKKDEHPRSVLVQRQPDKDEVLAMMAKIKDLYEALS